MCWQGNALRSKECVYWRDWTNDQTTKLQILRRQLKEQSAECSPRVQTAAQSGSLHVQRSSERKNKVPTEVRVWMLTKNDLRDNSWNTSFNNLWSKLLSRVSQLDVIGIHHICGRSISQHDRFVTHRRVNKDSQCRNDKMMVKGWQRVQDELGHAANVGPHNDSACGKQHVGVVCLVPACSGARIYQRSKVEKTPPVPRDRSINPVRNWSRSAHPPRTGQVTTAKSRGLDGRSGSEGEWTPWLGRPWKQGLTTWAVPAATAPMFQIQTKQPGKGRQNTANTVQLRRSWRFQVR